MQYFKSKASITGIATQSKDNVLNKKAVVLANTSFKVVEGKLFKGQLPVSSFRTDDKGNFYLELPIGIYSIVEDERPEVFTLMKPTATQKWDNRCRKKHWQTPLFILKVPTTDAQKIAINKRIADDDPCLIK